MPLSEHEQRILEQYEKELQQDPHLSKRIGRSSLYTGIARRVAGFVVMLLSGLVIYHYLKRVGRDQLMARGGRLPMAGWLARLGERFRGRPDKPS